MSATVTPVAEETAPTPIGYEDAEYWLIVSNSGQKESFRLLPANGESCDIMKSPLDGSVMGLKVVYCDPKTKEVVGRRYFHGLNIFHFDQVQVKDAIYANGDSPAEREFKRREVEKANRIERLEQLRNEKLDDLDDE
jgi:hypothetical protein